MKSQKTKTTNDILATDTPATNREYLVLQMRETCKRLQDLERLMKTETGKQARLNLQAFIYEAKIEHLKSVQEFVSFLRGNQPQTKPVTHLKLA
jgi:cation transport regulator ChaC